ncbi:hypothetical protein SAMN05192575_101730 [Nocardioides alpinus]|uniref:Uncharacterized protein n=1 Tax=Nocardioides alpinus TaxID=748909 RepID=A0A1I0W5G9_9ACTN|nr:hypothetical protein SAMN05192575_101730 [Nocardioides alpinus]
MDDDELAPTQERVDVGLGDAGVAELATRDNAVLLGEEGADGVESHDVRLPGPAAADARSELPVDNLATTTTGKIVIDMSRPASPILTTTRPQASDVDRDGLVCSSASLSRVGTTKR